MRFCDICDSVMSKNTSATGQIVFQCRCLNSAEGAPEDTLMASGTMEGDATDRTVHDTFIDNAPFDPAATVVLRDCPQCGLNFLTMIRIGESETTVYSCSCGYRITHA